MADVDPILADFITAHRAGDGPDPDAYLARVDGLDRRELEALIDGYLARAPGRPWNPDAFRGSSAERLVSTLAPSLTSQAGLWPTVLPQLRDQAQLKRAELVERLAAELGVSEQREKVAGYYHEMEVGSLPPAGVSQRVLEALGKIVGQSAEALRRAGAALEAAGEGPGGVPVLARTALQDPSYEHSLASPASAEGPDESWDEIDELFRGGA